MPRGAEYANEPPASDNAIQQGQDAIHGAGKTTDEAPLQHTKHVAPLPEGMSEMNDRNLSGGAAPGHESGKGGHGIKGNDNKKGFGDLPGPPEQKEALATGATEMGDRDHPELHQKARGSSK